MPNLDLLIEVTLKDLSKHIQWLGSIILIFIVVKSEKWEQQTGHVAFVPGQSLS